MKSVAAIFGPTVIIFALVFVTTTDWFREWINPQPYWEAKVARYSELLATYTEDLRQCRSDLERLRLPSSREIWIKQKVLEGLTPVEAAKDYQIGLEARKAGCDFAADALPSTAADLEKTRAKLQTTR